MAEARSKGESIRHWIVEHKLRTVACLWLSGIGGSFAYNWSRPNMKPSVKIIHARLHAQALTLAALVGAAAVEYVDRQSSPGPKMANYTRSTYEDDHFLAGGGYVSNYEKLLMSKQSSWIPI